MGSNSYGISNAIIRKTKKDSFRVCRLVIWLLQDSLDWRMQTFLEGASNSTLYSDLSAEVFVFGQITVHLLVEAGNSPLDLEPNWQFYLVGHYS